MVMAALLVAGGCGRRGEEAPRKDLNLFALREEFGRGRYAEVLRMMSEFRGAFETNSRRAVAELRVETLERLVGRLNAELPQSNRLAHVRKVMGEYGRFGIRYTDPVFHTSGEEYEELFGLLPKVPRSRIEAYLAAGERPSVQDVYLKRVERVLALWDEDRIETKDRREVLRRLLEGLTSRVGLEDGKGLDRSVAGVLSQVTERLRKEGRTEDGIAARFIDLALAKVSADRRKVEGLMEELSRTAGEGPHAAVVTYWKANRAFLAKEREKALALYREAQRKAAALSDADLRRWLILEHPSAEHFRQDIAKRIALVKAEMEQERMLSGRHDVAVVAGDQVRLRKTMEAKGSKNVVTSLATGQRVMVLRQSEEKVTVDGYTDHWYYVKVPGGAEGWVFGKYLLFY